MGHIQVYEPVKNFTFPVTLVDPGQFAACANSTASPYDAGTSRAGYIDDVGEEGYTVTQPIPYTIERIEDGDFRATAETLNVAVDGDDWVDAFQALVAAILDTFDTLTAEDVLSANAQAQLVALQAHLVKTADNA